MANLLIRRGADLWKSNSFGMNPMQALADQPGKRRVLDAVCEAYNKRLREAVRWLRRKELVLLLCSSYHNGDGRSPRRSDEATFVEKVFSTHDLAHCIARFL